MGFFNRKNTWIKEQGYALRITGWGQVFPFFLPGEKKRLAKADAESREMIKYFADHRKDASVDLTYSGKELVTKDNVEIVLFPANGEDLIYFETYDRETVGDDWAYRLTKDEALQLSRMLSEAAK